MSGDFSQSSATNGFVKSGGFATGDIETARDFDWFVRSESQESLL